MRKTYSFTTDGQIVDLTAELRAHGHIDTSLGIEYGTGGTGTFVVEVGIANNWVALGLFPVSGSGTAAASINAAGVWNAPLVGVDRLRVRQSAAGTCTIGIAINSAV